jgi:hypothetical protein
MRPELKIVERDLSGTLDAALEISKRRANNLRELRQALERNDDALALSIARRLVGLNDQESDRAFKG